MFIFHYSLSFDARSIFSINSTKNYSLKDSHGSNIVNLNFPAPQLILLRIQLSNFWALMRPLQRFLHRVISLWCIEKSNVENLLTHLCTHNINQAKIRNYKKNTCGSGPCHDGKFFTFSTIRPQLEWRFSGELKQHRNSICQQTQKRNFLNG